MLSAQWNTLYNKRQRVGPALHSEMMAVPPISLPSLFHHEKESGQLSWALGMRLGTGFLVLSLGSPALSWLGVGPWYPVWCQLPSPSTGWTDPHGAIWFCSGQLWKCFRNLFFIILWHLEQSAGEGVVSVWNASQISTDTRTEHNSCCCRFHRERFLLH